ncbi:MAG: alpha-L-fucosidase [Bacteroidaceae bacterium]|nr:alpha-L-fucosidase [Bacteroidaceae bacterium]
MKKLFLLSALMAVMGLSASAQLTDVAVQTGSFSADWKSLDAWECPDWFKDAKFGIWAHWGPQCHAEDGDWYARFMYYEGTGQNQWHYEHFGDPEVFGLKDLCNDWKAQNWDPEKLVNLYKSVGARYFMALGNHHDNFDLWESPYQEWNSVNVGPKKDIVKGWSEACKKAGLPLGVSIHASHAWTWLEPSQEYDGNLTKEDGYTLNADGTEKWWKGMDPQELYAQNHAHSKGWDNSGTIHSQWDWGNGASLPSAEYKQKFQNRVLELINDYNPDMIYFDDTAMPFYGCDDEVGKNILTHYYNRSAAANGGAPNVVVTGKQLDADQKKHMMWDVERGIPDRMQSEYWQTCTCIGSWHYDQSTYKNNGYKSGATVVRMLVDIISKNGNLLLSIPVKSDGTIDEKEEQVLADIKAWMDVNGESVYGTRTWKTFGEGPLADAVNPMNAQGFNEGQNYSSQDVRYVQKDGTIYATIMAWPAAGRFSLKSFSMASEYYSGKVTSVKLLGGGDVEFSQGIEGLTLMVPSVHPNEIAPVFAITVEEVALSAYEQLQEAITSMEAYIATMKDEASYMNTGKLSTLYLPTLQEAVQEAKKVGKDASDKEVAAAQEALLAAYNDFLKNGRNKGGKFDGIYESDLTTEVLVEGQDFTRQAGGNDRFGDPMYWTVENFNIPNGGDGTKAGLDKYSGREALYLGLWNDRSSNTEGDLTNARIYRKVHLEAGAYYFGAGYNTHYNISQSAYMFVSSELYSTADLPQRSIAYYPIADVTEDLQLCGLWFKLDEAQDVYIGFQADLANGSDTQEFRAEKVAFYRLSDANAYALESLLLDIDGQLEEMEAGLSENTGFYNKAAWEKMRAVADDFLGRVDNLSADESSKAYYELSEQWADFLTNGRNKGGLVDADNSEDVTVEVLTEKREFSRADESVTTRFATPKYWTVENFQIPNGGDGTKNGLDKYTGVDALMLGVWDDRQNNESGDLTNARIYQKVSLEAGRYFWGTTFNALYQLNEAYIFVSDQLLPTSQVTTRSLAYISINECANDGQTYGLYFTLPEAQEVYLGFQVDLANGSSTQEFRAETLSLLKYNDLTNAVLQELVESVEEALQLAALHINENTGFYQQEAYDAVKDVLDEVKEKAESATGSEIQSLYDQLRTAYNDFLANGRNKGGIFVDEDMEDLTEEKLVETSNFSRADEGVTSRFASPKYWTVENYDIPSSSEGVRGGLDSYPGRDNLTLGVWDDKENAPETSDISNARIYRKVSLDAGRYFFGGIYNTIYNLNEAYVFAASEPLSTGDIPTNSIAYMSVSECTSDGNYWGINFTLPEAQEVLLGWQADLLGGANAQEFRVEKVKLAKQKSGEYDAITTIGTDLNTAPVEIYTLQGIRLGSIPTHGIYIVKQGGRVRKVRF